MPDHKESNGEPADMRQRLDNVKARINKMSPQDEKALPNTNGIGTKRQTDGRALQIGSDLIGGVVVGGLIGYGLDVWRGTKPLWFLTFFLLGMMAGLLNVLRTARKLQKERDELVKRGELDIGHDLTDDDEE